MVLYGKESLNNWCFVYVFCVFHVKTLSAAHTILLPNTYKIICQRVTIIDDQMSEGVFSRLTKNTV